jgi:hypothetical protein
MNARVPLPLKDGLLFQGDGSASHTAGVEAPCRLYVVESGELAEVRDLASFRRNGYSQDDVQIIPDSHLAMMMAPGGPEDPPEPPPRPPLPRPPFPLPIPIPAPPPGLEVTLDLDSDLGAGHFMRTHGMLRNTGIGSSRLDAQTRTFTVTWFGGFHGGVQAVFSDVDGIAIGCSPIQRFGVDGRWVGRSDRTDYWGMDVDPALASRVTRISLFHFWDPDSLVSVIDRAVKTLTPLITLTTAILAMGGKGATSA